MCGWRGDASGAVLLIVHSNGRSMQWMGNVECGRWEAPIWAKAGIGVWAKMGDELRAQNGQWNHAKEWKSKRCRACGGEKPSQHINLIQNIRRGIGGEGMD